MHLTLKEQFTIVTDLRVGRLRLRPLKVMFLLGRIFNLDHGGHCHGGLSARRPAHAAATYLRGIFLEGRVSIRL